jgi:hypothetical protein
MGLITCVSLEDWFTAQLKNLKASTDAKAYLVSLFSSMKNTKQDMSDKSIVLSFADARINRDFAGLQRIGDWTIFSLSLTPQALKEKKLVIDMARISYYSCWKMTSCTWKVYEELADELPRIGDDCYSLINITLRDASLFPRRDFL